MLCFLNAHYNEQMDTSSRQIFKLPQSDFPVIKICFEYKKSISIQQRSGYLRAFCVTNLDGFDEHCELRSTK